MDRLLKWKRHPSPPPPYASRDLSGDMFQEWTWDILLDRTRV